MHQSKGLFVKPVKLPETTAAAAYIINDRKFVFKNHVYWMYYTSEFSRGILTVYFLLLPRLI